MAQIKLLKIVLMIDNGLRIRVLGLESQLLVLLKLKSDYFTEKQDDL